VSMLTKEGPEEAGETGGDEDETEQEGKKENEMEKKEKKVGLITRASSTFWSGVRRGGDESTILVRPGRKRASVLAGW
jgi:hypothetical protein